jgi:hypothetical protein
VGRVKKQLVIIQDMGLSRGGREEEREKGGRKKSWDREREIFDVCYFAELG